MQDTVRGNIISKRMKSNSPNHSNVAILGLQLQTLRKSKGLTRQKLCEIARVSPAFLFQLEHGLLKRPSLEHTGGVGVAGSNPVTPNNFKPCKTLIYNDLQGFLILYLQMMYFRIFCAITGFAANYSDNIPTNI